MRTQQPPAVETERAADLDLEQIAGFDREPQRCECDHGDEFEYAACGRKAKWRVTIDCVCGENHPRTVEILCSRCLRTLREDQGDDTITVRRL